MNHIFYFFSGNFVGPIENKVHIASCPQRVRCDGTEPDCSSKAKIACDKDPKCRGFEWTDKDKEVKLCPASPLKKKSNWKSWQKIGWIFS